MARFNLQLRRWFDCPCPRRLRRDLAHVNLLRVQELEDRTAPATFTINSTSDAVVSDGNLTLREAITSCNLGNNSGLSVTEKTLVTGVYGTADTIVFTGLSGTITLGGTQLPLVNKSLVISGPGATSLSLSGNNLSRILQF